MRALHWLASIAGLLWTCLAAAEQPAPTSEDPQLLFDTGLQSMLRGEYGIGCALIKRSLDLDPRPGTIFTLAECYAKAGKFASAIETYDAFLALEGKLSPDAWARQAKRAEISAKQRAQLIAKVPWLTVVLPPEAPKSITVTMDQKPFAPNLLGIAFAADPGHHQFSTSIPGGVLTEQDVQLEPGDRKTIVLNVVGAGGEPTSEPEQDTQPTTPEPASKGPSTWVYVAGGIGIVGLATGAVTGIILLDKRNTINDECDRGEEGTWKCRSQKGINALDSAQNVFAPITTVALGVGVAGIATAAILWLTTGSKEEAQTGALMPEFTMRKDGAAAALRGSF